MKAFIYTLAALICIHPIFSQPEGSKRGLSNVNTQTYDMNATQGKVHWWYNWGQTPDNVLSATYTNYGYEFVPMVWGAQFDQNFISANIKSDAQFLLGFNEPNFMSQANMTAQQAADLWPQLEAIANTHGLKLVSPATNWCGDCVSGYGNDPLDWLDDFFAKCTGCQVDYVALHWYSCSGESMQNEVNRYKKYGVPIWVTEFACWDIPQADMTLEAQQNYLVQSVDILEADPDVFRYSWFAPVTAGQHPYLALFSGNSSSPLTELGKIYNKMPVHDESYYYQAPLRLEAEQYATADGIMLQLTEDDIGFTNVGWIDTGDWLEYKVEIPVQANYTIWFRTASPSGAGAFDFLVDGNVIQNVSTPNTGDWQAWETSSITTNLAAGQHTIRLNITSAGFNINWMVFDDGSLANSLSVSDQMKQEKLLIYPNAIQKGGRMTVEMPGSLLGKTQVEVNICNNLGQLMYHETAAVDNTSSFFLDEKLSSRLNSGSYTMQVSGDHYQGFGRFVVK